MNKHLLSILDLSSDDIFTIIERSESLKRDKRNGIFVQSLREKNIGLFFEKLSTRTRLSFEAGINDLGANPIFINPNDIQLGRGETIGDTAKVVSSYLDAVIFRTYGQERIEEFAKFSNIPVINALTDFEHPTQIISDLFSIAETGKDIKNIKIAFIGDGNNIANSFIFASSLIGYKMVIASPPGYEPDKKLINSSNKDLVEITNNPLDACSNADVIYTDVWISMGQEGEKEERLSVFKDYQVNSNLVSQAKDDLLIMHCLPAHRGEEITDEVINDPRSIVFEQAENKLHSGKAILEFLLAN